eukprot:scaffold17710_cov92-Phaeocystis_antarctica.AAC.6
MRGARCSKRSAACMPLRTSGMPASAQVAAHQYAHRVGGSQPPSSVYNGDNASAVAPRRAGVARVLAKHVEHVAEVEPHRLHAQLDLARRQRHLEGGLLLEPQAANRTARLQVKA